MTSTTSRNHAGESALALRRRGMTLPELLIGMAIMGLMVVVLAGMSNAVNSAWTYTKGVEITEQNSAAAIDRIKYMLAQTGTYDLTGQPPRLGLAVVTRTVGSASIPDVLVLWTGGRNGGMSALGTQARLPVASELLVYTWDSTTPNQLLEVAFPNSSNNVDFADTSFSDTITKLLASSVAADRIPLCDRLRVVSLSTTPATTAVAVADTAYGSGSMYGASVSTTPTITTSTTAASNASATQSVGCARFGIVWAPTDAELASTTVGSTQWYQLNWPQGAVGSRSGMRQATLNVELQIEPDGVVAGTGTVNAIPFFDSGSVRYVYEP